MSNYTLKINGADASELRSLGMAFGSMKLVNMQPDSLSLRWTRRRVSEVCPISYNDVVEIFQNGRRLFHGRARPGTMTSEGQSIDVVGPWSHLDEQIYQLSLWYDSYGQPEGKLLGDTFTAVVPAGTQIWRGGVGGWYTLPYDHEITWTVSTRASYAGYPATTGELDVNMLWASRCWIFKPVLSATKFYTTIQDEWSRVMDYVAHTHDPAIFDLGTVQLGKVLGPRTRTLADSPVSETLRQVLALKPDTAVWWDYSSPGLPKINARVASLEAPLELSIGTRAVQEYQLKVADELVPSGVIIRWESEQGDSEDTGLGRPYLADFYPGSIHLGPCSYSNGSTTLTAASTAGLEVGMKLTGLYLPNGVTITAITGPATITMSEAPSGLPTSPYDDIRVVARKATGAVCYQPGVLLHTISEGTTFIAPGLAKEVYDSLAVRRAQGSLVILDRDFSLGLRPGRVITLSGDPTFAGVQLWVQSVAWSPGDGLARLTVGYPAHLQLRDRADLKGWFKISFTGVFGEVNTWIVPQ